MKLPFTTEQFLDVFRTYNQTVFPMQIILFLLGVSAIFLSIKKIETANSMINLILSLLWLWMGIVYHLLYFAEINKAAYIFGASFILQGILFFYFGVVKKELSYTFRFERKKWLGAALIVFALLLYPFLGYLLGHVYPASPTFGLPCPTTIFTFGILLWYDKKLRSIILIIPFLWSLIGFFAAIYLGIHEDASLLMAGLITIGMISFQRRHAQVSNN